MKRKHARLARVAAMILVASGCQKAPSGAAPDAATRSLAAPSAAAPVPQPSPAPCSLLTAAEVGAIMEKKLVQSPNSCDYGLDPSVMEQQFAKRQGALQHAAESGDLSALMSSMSQDPAHHQGPAGGAMDQLDVKLDASRDDQTEAAVKAIYARTGQVVRGVAQPEKRGLQGVIQGFHDIDGVGDWAFATNVAALDMGFGFSERGRILEARKGPWHVTVSATVAPDPGAAALDAHLAKLAGALLAKL